MRHDVYRIINNGVEIDKKTPKTIPKEQNGKDTPCFERNGLTGRSSDVLSFQFPGLDEADGQFTGPGHVHQAHQQVTKLWKIEKESG
ncbi:hypothetical protein CEXT_484831 [Caerostris extrusa]|uniref:Uncharacterized protein n=1 Tax=Caerostris extrusa TaxID=172846 RepID=A0AAV4VHS6_CAEEX|nr:hypothetical protein CEXT_484831 [Caerostris extrusa]